MVKTYGKYSPLATNNKAIIIGIMSGLAIALNVLEFFIILPIPFIRIGLSNVITLFFIYKEEYKIAIGITIVRIIVSNFLTSKLFSIFFMMSFFGGVASTLFMIFFYLIFKNFFSITTNSISGAIVHNMVQLLIFSLLMSNFSIIKNLWITFLIISLIAGVITAYFAFNLLNHEFKQKTGEHNK